MIPRGGLDFPVPACINEMHNFSHLRRSGGTGRRAGLKIPWPQGREGSTPSSGTSLFPEPVHGGRTGFGRRAGGDTPQQHHRPEQNQEMSPVDMERESAVTFGHAGRLVTKDRPNRQQADSACPSP